VQSADLVPLMVALGARVRLVSTLGERVIDAAALYRDDGINYLRKRHDELLADIQLPPTNGWRATYQKLRRRGAFDFPVLGVAVRLDAGDDGTVKAARVILGGIAPAPVEVRDAGAALVGGPLDEERMRRAAEACYVKARPLDNTDFVMNWRKQMTKPYVMRALEELKAGMRAKDEG
jgi:4-hydroxybenzoyl-CoA reductase subunit beta